MWQIYSRQHYIPPKIFQQEGGPLQGYTHALSPAEHSPALQRLQYPSCSPGVRPCPRPPWHRRAVTNHPQEWGIHSVQVLQTEPQPPKPQVPMPQVYQRGTVQDPGRNTHFRFCSLCSSLEYSSHLLHFDTAKSLYFA